MEIRPFQDGPRVLPLDTEFWVPDWFRFTGCRWNSQSRKGARDRDGQAQYRYLKKFAMEGSVAGYKYGEFPKFPLGYGCQAGLICSPHALFMVVECDNESEWDAALTGAAVPTVRSNRGHHYYFAVPEALTDLMPTDGPVPGGDVQTRGFVPAPGTRHPAGTVYSLVADKINVADAELLYRLRDAREREKARQLEQYRKQGGSKWSGNGGLNGQDDYLSQVVAWNAVREGKTEAEAREIWQREAAALPLKDPLAPWTEDDFQRHYRGAVRKRKEQESGGRADEVDESLRSWAENPGGGTSARPENRDQFLPPGYKIPAGFSLTSGGVWHEIKVGKQTDEVRVTHCPVYVSGLEKDESGVTWYELTWLSQDGSQRSKVIDSGDVADRTRLLKAFPEVVVTSKGATTAGEYLSELRTVNAKWLASRTRTVALRLGWYGDSESAVFTAGPGRPYAVRDTANLGGWLHGHRTRGSLEEWAALLHRMPPRVVLLTAAALSAPLLRLLEVPGFIFDNSGGTTQGKTRAARVAASAWGDPDRLLLAWSDTKAALELRSQKAHGVPLLIDDSKLARDSDQIAQLIYQVTSGMTTGRLERSADRLRGGGEISTVIVTNGETPLLTAGKSGRRDGGAVARVLEMWGAPFSTAEEADSVSVVIRDHHGLAGASFVEAALAVGAGELRSRYQELRTHARTLTRTDVARRRADAAAVVMLTASVARERGLLPDIPVNAWSSLLNDDAAQEGSDDLGLAALELIWNEVALNETCFWRKDSDSFTSMMDRPRDGWKGRYEPKEGWLAVKPDWLDKFLSDRGYDPEGVRRGWSDRNWLSRDKNGKRTVSVYIGSKVARCVKVIFRPESFAQEDANDFSEAES